MQDESYGPFDDAAIERGAQAMFADWVETEYDYIGSGEWASLDAETQDIWRASTLKVLRAAAGEGGSGDA